MAFSASWSPSLLRKFAPFWNQKVEDFEYCETVQGMSKATLLVSVSLLARFVHHFFAESDQASVEPPAGFQGHLLANLGRYMLPSSGPQSDLFDAMSTFC